MARRKKLKNNNKIIKELNECQLLQPDVGVIQEITAKISKNNTKTVTMKHQPKYWWNEEIEKAVESRKEALTRYNRLSSTENLIELNRLTAVIKKKIKKSKRKKQEELIEEINPRTPVKRVWEIANMLKGSNNKESFNLISEDPRAAENFLKLNYGNIETIKCYRENKSTDEIMKLEDFDKIISNKRNSAPGKDEISYEILKNLTEEKKQIIVQSLNLIWGEGKLPESLKETLIIPIQKEGKDPNELKSYRPISLVPVLTKILNEAARNQLRKIMKEEKMIPDTSLGYREDMSAADCLILMTQIVKNAERKGKKVAIVFMDCEGAFNEVDVDKLAETMEQKRVPQKIVNWVFNALINRKLIIRTAEGEVTGMVSQGASRRRSLDR